MSHRSHGHESTAVPLDRADRDEETMLEELAVAEEELHVQSETLLQMTAALEREHARYRELFQHAPIPYLVTDAFGTIREANRAAAVLLGCRENRLMGKPLVVFAHDPSRRRMRHVISRMLDVEESMTVHFSLVARRRRPTRIEATVAAARDHTGKLTEIRWLFVDRTRERKAGRLRQREARELDALIVERTAEMERAQRAKDRLVAAVSHELRTGLSAVGGYAELLEGGMRGPLSPPQLADVARIHRAYEHLARIVDDLLNYAKVSSGQLDLDITQFCLGDVLVGALELVAPRAAERGVTVLLSDDGPAVAARADVERVRQIIVNLLSNALKFGGTGPVKVRCGIEQGRATIEVADTGQGIPPASHASIFEPFVRVSVDPHISGTGLGLAISRDLARAMGGDLVLTPSEHGATFQLSLPLAAPLARGSAST